MQERVARGSAAALKGKCSLKAANREEGACEEKKKLEKEEVVVALFPDWWTVRMSTER